MATKRYISQSTGRHVIKRTDASNTIEFSFGVFEALGTDTGHTNFPSDVVYDAANSAVYVADSNNRRVLKLTDELVYVTDINVNAFVETPIKLFLDGSDLYVAGINNAAFLSMGKIDVTSFSTVDKFTKNIKVVDGYPKGFSDDFTASQFILTGIGGDLSIIAENATGFADMGVQDVIGQDPTKYFGHVKHSTGDLYLSSRRGVVRVNSSYTNTGDSNPLSKVLSYVSESEVDNTLLLYDVNVPKIIRADINLNFVEEVYEDTGDTLATDATYISSMIEVDI